jgi:DNA-binding XRE family transcriptional regulator
LEDDVRPVYPTASGDPLRIGARLRAARKSHGLTIEQLASASGLTGGFLSRVERDETSPSVTTLVSLCQVLSLDVGSLFKASDMGVVTLASAPALRMGGVGAVEKLLTPRAQSKVQMLRSSLAPGATGGDEMFTVNCEVEVTHVLVGTLEIMLPTETLTLGEGDTLTMPGREPYTWRNPSADTTEVIWVLVPAAWSGTIGD